MGHSKVSHKTPLNIRRSPYQVICKIFYTRSKVILLKPVTPLTTVSMTRNSTHRLQTGQCPLFPRLCITYSEVTYKDMGQGNNRTFGPSLIWLEVTEAVVYGVTGFSQSNNVTYLVIYPIKYVFVVISVT